MGKFKIGRRSIRYKVERSGRSRYLALRLNDEHALEIRLPRGAKVKVREILESKRDWIERKSRDLSRRRRLIGLRRVHYRGRPYWLKPVRVGERGVRIRGNEVRVYTGKGESARFMLKKWMARKTEAYAKRRAEKFAKKIGVDFSGEARAIDTKSWGRRSGKNLFFNWQLRALPDKLADYVVAHEVAHLGEPSHSRNFKRRLAAVCPDYKEMEKELRTYRLIPSF